MIFPVTDKSAWSFSKTDLYGIYKSKSFFLPTPPPREVFRRRVDFIRRKVPSDSLPGKKRDYFVGKGIRLSIDKIGDFAAILEDVFVENEYTSRVIGEISNFNIRRTLALAQRVITSGVLRVEDIFKAVATGHYTPLPHAKFLHSLLSGDYELYRQSDSNSSIYPLFQADDKVRQSPILVVRILALLENTQKSARNVEDRHLSVQSIVDYFSAIGHSEVGIESALILMLQAGLVEPYDPSVQDLLPSQRLAATSRGMRHIKLALHEQVFLGQMALTTAILDHSVAERIRSTYKSDARFADRMSTIRSLFVEYLLEEDRSNLTIPPEGDQYETQRYVTARLRKLASVPDEDSTQPSGATKDEEPISGVICTVDWFDAEKGFGFVDVEGQSEQAFLGRDTLQEGGINRAFDGDRLSCDVARNQKGLYVKSVYGFENSTVVVEEADGVVTRIFRDRRYGFIRIPKKGMDAFFHFSIFSKGLPEGFGEGSPCRVEISPDKTGENCQVRRFL